MRAAASLALVRRRELDEEFAGHAGHGRGRCAAFGAGVSSARDACERRVVERVLAVS